MSDVGVESGVIRGRRHRGVVVWRSIPYAAPPTGPLRFRAPQAVVPWTGVRDATRFGNAAHSHVFSSPLGIVKRQVQDEDCLTLNVCAPAEGGPPRPVLVFIHGGGFFEGSAALPVHDPEPLVRRFGLVLVTINYRLGGLGFVDFSQYAPDFETNVGLRDQLAALAWVRRNIAAFGGDPGAITLWGQSAGASAILTHMAVPAAKGLFHRAIAQSPIADAVRTPEQAAETARRVVDALGLDGENAAGRLRTVPAQAITKAAISVMLRTAREVPCRMALAPVIDGDLLPEDPIAAIEAGHAHRVPLVVGSMRDEMGHAGWRPVRRFVDLFPTTPERVERMFAATDPQARTRVLAHYPRYPAAAALTRLTTDCFFVRPMLAAAEGHARYAATYVYRFDYAAPVLRLIGMGAIHATDVPMAFGGDSPALTAFAVGGRRGYRATSDWVQRHWFEFAQTGAPGWPSYGADRVTQVIDYPESPLVPGLYSATGEAWRHYRGPQREARSSAAQ